MTARLSLTIQIPEDAYHRLCARARESKQSPQERASDEISGRSFAAGLTPRQAELLSFVDGYVKARDGIAPTFAEMAAHLGLKTKSNVHRILTQLEERGRIRRIPSRTRAIEIVRAAA